MKLIRLKIRMHMVWSLALHLPAQEEEEWGGGVGMSEEEEEEK